MADYRHADYAGSFLPDSPVWSSSLLDHRIRGIEHMVHVFGHLLLAWPKLAVRGILDTELRAQRDDPLGTAAYPGR